MNIPNRSKRVSLLSLIAALQATASFAAVPPAMIEGLIAAEAPGHPSRNGIYSASALDLDVYDYIEE